jgi:hypothetical protein
MEEEKDEEPATPFKRARSVKRRCQPRSTNRSRKEVLVRRREPVLWSQ